MTDDQIGAAWAIQGPLARRASFRIVREDGRLDLIADLTGTPGRFMRGYQSVPASATDAEVESAISLLYHVLGGLPDAAERISKQTFSERLADE